MENGYLFYVRGREAILSRLEDALCGEEAALTDDLIANQDDGLYGERILRAALCDEAENDEQAVRMAVELVSLCNGIIVACMTSILYERQISLEELFTSEATSIPSEFHLPNRHQAVTLERAYRGTIPLNLPNLNYDDLGLLPDLAMKRSATLVLALSDRCLASNFIALAFHNEGVYLLLRLFALEINWISVYRILETLETLMNEDSFATPIDKSDRDALTNSANNFSITGLRSRHGLKQAGKPNKSRKASLNEAFETVRAATNAYLQFKLQQVGPPSQL